MRWRKGATKPTGLSEEARRRGVSRQRIWQERQVARSRCQTCGRKVTKRSRNFCEQHRVLYNYRQNRRNAVRREARQSS